MRWVASLGVESHAVAVTDRLLRFDLPFPLQLRDSMGVIEPAAKVEDYADGIYVAGDPPAEARVALRLNQRPDIISFGILDGGDPYGRISYTRMQVRFNVKRSPETMGWTDDELIDQGLRVANRMIEIYRDVVHRPVLRQLSRDHVVHFLVIDGHSDGTFQTRAVARAAGPLRSGLGEEELAKEQEVRRRLQTDEPIEFVRALYLDMQSRLATSDFRLAVIDAETLFETWLRGFLAKHHLRKGLTESESDRRFLDGRGLPRSVTALARDEVKTATGFNFAVTTEYQAWATDARDLRNALVHGSRRTVSRGEARRAIDAVTLANTALMAAAPW